ncbi:uncharacterized protein LOC100366434 [Saccoglossus kowalevskii]|uniref:Uncharacterized protein LOC100366434 isoform X1 n=1 Tax=Saccoglossus kowalevskii TaxID=10224 RepID=A0ABM0GIJ9_SACKO|nr:PREDICTED: uncharacterized protein LOC100366434 isoform X1 [Saccoglossus kowalevskii]
MAWNLATCDHPAVLQHMQEANTQLLNEIRKIRCSEYKKLFQQTRSFLDALERTPLARHRSYGPSVRTMRQIRDCYHTSQKMDGERTTHYTVLLGYFIHLGDELRQLAINVKEWLGEPVEQLTVHPSQEACGRKILEELAFWDTFLNEDNDFTDLHKYKTLEEFRGLNTGEVSIYGAVVNLLPVMLKTIELITQEVTKWLNTTYRLGMGIFRNGRSILVQESSNGPAVRPGSRAGSYAGSRSGSRAEPRPVSSRDHRPSSRASYEHQRPGSRSSAMVERPSTARDRPCSRYGHTIATQTDFQRPASKDITRPASRDAPRTRIVSAPVSRRSYAEQLASRYNGRISLLERPPWKPSSQVPHNLYPKLHIHLGDNGY